MKSVYCSRLKLNVKKYFTEFDGYKLVRRIDFQLPFGNKILSNCMTVPLLKYCLIA